MYANAGASRALGTTMKTCMSNADTAGKKAACKDTTAKAALAASRGIAAGDVTPTMLNEFMQEGARDQMASQMNSCMKTAANQIAKNACSGTAGKNALAASLGKDAADITGFELAKFQEQAGEKGMATSMGSCMGSATTRSARDACKMTAMGTFATSMGKSAADFDTTDMEMALQGAAMGAMETAMTSCMANANVASARNACVDTNAKNALMTTMGKAEVTDMELKTFVEKGDATPPAVYK